MNEQIEEPEAEVISLFPTITELRAKALAESHRLRREACDEKRISR